MSYNVPGPLVSVFVAKGNGVRVGYFDCSAALLATAKHELGIEPGRPTSKGEVSLLSERCIGPCGLGPVVVYDQEVAAEETPKALALRLKNWMAT